MKLVRMRGFTLIEVAIVLVVIGLIVAVVTSGKTLVRAAQIRSVTSDISKYGTAVRLFKMQYDALPGDISNATTYWSTASGNGDGDGAMEWENELVYLWQHLSLAGIIIGPYSGVVAYNPGVTYPNGSLPGTGFYIGTVLGGGIQAYGWAESGANTIVYGSVVPGVNNGQPYAASLTAPEAYNLDAKLDDGRPYSGIARIRADGGTTCATGAYATHPNATQVSNNQFNITGTGVLCAPAISF